VGTGSLDGVAPRRMVIVSASVIFRCSINSRNSFLAPAHPGGPRKRAIKQLWWCGGVTANSGDTYVINLIAHSGPDFYTKKRRPSKTAALPKCHSHVYNSRTFQVLSKASNFKD